MKKIKIFVLVCCMIVFVMGTITINALENNKLIKNTLLFNNDNITVSRSKTIDYGEEIMDVYTDSDKNEYLYVDDNLVGFIKNVEIVDDSNLQTSESTLNNSNKITKSNNYKTIANDIANSIVNSEKTSFENYELASIDYVESYGEFVYKYVKTIDGYDTNDTITVSLDSDGELRSFIANRQGLFDNYEYINIDEVSVDEFIVEQMKADEFKNIVSYKVEKEFINFINNKLVLEIFVEIQIDSNRYGMISLYYPL